MALTPSKAPEAFANMEPKLAALATDAILPVEADIPTAVGVVLAALPKLREMRAAIASELPHHPVHFIDELEEIAHAAWFADVVTAQSGDGERLTKLTEEVTALRDGLLVAAEALAHRGLLDREAVAVIRRGQGDADAARDIGALAQMFTAEWPNVGAKTAVEKRELERAAKIGPELMFALAAKKQAGKTGASDPAEVRARAFTLLSLAYEASRRAVNYLRWNEGDADSIAPPIAKKRGPRKAKGASEPQPLANGVAAQDDVAALDASV